MLDANFLNILRGKLANSSTTSSLLNCIPGTNLTKVDAFELNLIDPTLANSFVQQLLTEDKFSFPISYQNIPEEELDEEKKLYLEKLSKKMNRIYNDNELSFQEKGHKTFGFGYPILVMEVEDSWVQKKVGAKEKEKRLICAPLFIWPLEIKKSFKQNRSWTITQSGENAPFINDTFISYIKQKRQVDLSKALSKDNDEFITFDQLQKDVSIIVRAVNTYEKNTTEIKVPTDLIVPLRTKEELKKIASINGHIEWSGIFSLYSKQKQNLINEIDQLIERKEEFTEINETEQDETTNVLNYGYSSIDTDPSQQSVLNQIEKDERIVIQGPPGTGKSQTLTALITNALSKNQKILVVCEKNTALQVIYDNLEKIGLNDLCAVINDPFSKDRQKIVEKVRSAPLVNYPRTSDIRLNNTMEEIKKKIEVLSQGYKSLAEQIWEDQTWSDMLGKYLKTKKIIHLNPLKSNLKKIKWDLDTDEYKLIKALIINAQELNNKNLSKLDFELNKSFFTGEQKGLVKETIQDIVNEYLVETNKLISKYADLPQKYEKDLNIYYTSFNSEIQSSLIEFFKNYDHLKLLDPMILEMPPLSLKDYLMKLTSIFFSKIKKINKYRLDLIQNYKNIQVLYGKLDGPEWLFLKDPELIPIKALKENTLLFEKLCKDYFINLKSEISKNVQEVLKGNDKVKGISIQNLNELSQELRSLLIQFNTTNLLENKIIEDIATSYNENCETLYKINKDLQSINSNLKFFSQYFDFQKFKGGLNEKAQEIINIFIDFENNEQYNFADIFDNFYLEKFLLQTQKLDIPKNDTALLELYDNITKLKQLLIQKILSASSYEQSNCINRFPSYKGLYNLRGAGGQRRNSLRQIIQRDFNFFTSFFPISLTNPSACAVLFPLQQDIFDIVIFDEASQLRLEDTYSSLIRGKIKVISGDQHQMPPPRTYEPSDTGEDNDDENEIIEESKILDSNITKSLANSESLLDYVLTTGYTKKQLLVHYRSNHPALIEFSNNAFYSGNLLPIIKEGGYTPIIFKRVDGLYIDRTNPEEADKVIEILDEIVDLDKGICPSVGVATFNLHQRDLINEKISIKAAADSKFAEKYILLSKKGLFVKNLENIQGDERDIIIMTTTFGPDKEGRFHQRFGPPGNNNGYRLLNVIVTRAKDKFYICTSIPEEKILSYESALKTKGKNDGVPIIYSYLAYAKAISENNEQNTKHILEVVKKYSTEEKIVTTNMALTESPFEDEVYDELVRILKGSSRIKPQKWIGSFRVDFLIEPIDENRKPLIIECDGASYHNTSEAYAYDYFRMKQLQENGYAICRIWSTNWWDEDDFKTEVEFLKEILSEYDAPISKSSAFYKGAIEGKTEITINNNELPLTEEKVDVEKIDIKPKEVIENDKRPNTQINVVEAFRIKLTSENTLVVSTELSHQKHLFYIFITSSNFTGFTKKGFTLSHEKTLEFIKILRIFEKERQEINFNFMDTDTKILKISQINDRVDIRVFINSESYQGPSKGGFRMKNEQFKEYLEKLLITFR